jgi:hypothetical protein
MTKNLFISELVTAFKGKKEFTNKDVQAFYAAHIADVKISTVNWKIYHLVMQGVIVRKRKGVFFIPDVKK